jgi:acetolactate synthase-1/2/3 large subunit
VNDGAGEHNPVNGAQKIISTLVTEGVEVAFANPGTSEMHFVAALDSVPEMRGVLGLFEGVVTGAADGYGRIAGKPAATLLHLGPGLANGLANLHNARRARTPLVNLVGDHATYHKHFDAPLESDIESLAAPMSGWVHRCSDVEALGADVEDAVRQAVGPPGRVATLIIPADLSWTQVGNGHPHPGAPPTDRATTGTSSMSSAGRKVDPDAIEGAAKALRAAGRSAILIGGRATRRRGLEAATRVADATGAKLLCETFPAVLDRGVGIPPVERLIYLSEFAIAQLEGITNLVLVDAASPVSFFAYPGTPSDLVPPGCSVHVLASGSDDVPGALEALAGLVAPPNGAGRQVGNGDGTRVIPPEAPSGALDSRSVAAAIAATLPEGAIVSDESNTAGIWISGATASCPPHEWMTLTGGAIGQGLPVGTGAAIAAPDRRVICLEADGSAMYTLQSWWTQARESLDVTTVILENHSYAILELELSRVGAEPPGPIAKAMLELDPPPLDFVSLARGMGVPAWRAGSAEDLTMLLRRSTREPGPSVIVADTGRGLG